MNQSDSVFRLIHSLTRSEKRYFTITAKVNRNSSSYLKLFKAIDQQQEYDETALRKQFRNESFIKHFPVIKVQLYHFLLKTLRNFHESRSVDFTLKEVMLDAAILNEKALYVESNAKLKYARELALQYEDWKILLEILHKEYTLISTTSEKTNLEKELRRINSDGKNFISHLNNYGELTYLALSLTMLLKKYRTVRDPSKVEAIRTVMSHPLLKNEKLALSFRAKSLYYFIWSSYLMGTSQYEKADRYLTGQIDLYKEHHHFLQQAPGNYLGALNDLLVSRYRTGHYNEVLQLIQQLKKLSESNEIKRATSNRFRLVIFSWMFKMEVGVAIQTGSIHEQLKSIQQQEEFFHSHSDVMEPKRRLETLMALAAFYYHLHDQKKSVQLIETMLSDGTSAIHHEITTLARTLQIIIHYEEGNFDLLEYLTGGLRRFATQKSGITKTEKTLMEFDVKLENIHRYKNKRDFFEGYFKKLSALKKNRFERHNFDYFDLTVWLKGKLSHSG